MVVFLRQGAMTIIQSASISDSILEILSSSKEDSKFN